MENNRRSKRTPKPKGVPILLEVAKANNGKKNIEKIPRSKGPKTIDDHSVAPISIVNGNESCCKATMTSSTVAVGSVCTKRRKNRKLGTFIIDCAGINEKKPIDLEDFKVYLQGKIKVGRKRNDKRVKIEIQDGNILIHAEVFIEKKYIKYLVKLFFKGRQLNNSIRIVNGKHSYSLKYFPEENL